jgi:hypothetical protein
LTFCSLLNVDVISEALESNESVVKMSSEANSIPLSQSDAVQVVRTDTIFDVRIETRV